MKNTHQQSIQDCLPDLIGLPYDDYDCWGIVREFYKRHFKTDLEQYLYKDPNNHKEISKLIIKESPNYRKVLNPRFGDIILMRLYGLPAHLGIYIDENKILHTTDKTGSIVDSFQYWEKRILGFYRYGQD